MISQTGFYAIEKKTTLRQLKSAEYFVFSWKGRVSNSQKNLKDTFWQLTRRHNSCADTLRSFISKLMSSNAWNVIELSGSLKTTGNSCKGVRRWLKALSKYWRWLFNLTLMLEIESIYDVNVDFWGNIVKKCIKYMR